MTENHILVFLNDKKALILDKSSAIRNMVERVLIKMGVEKTNITSLKNYDHAIDYMQNERPEIIISDFEIHDRFGLDLLPLLDEYTSSPFERIFMVVTDNSADSAVADAAEEEVDGYLLKPFSSEQLEVYIQKIIFNKLSPSEYSKTIVKGKELLKFNKLKDARAQFVLALNQSNQPCLAYYFLGKIAYDHNNFDEALNYYKKSLQITPLHFKCLVGEFLIYLEQKKTDIAYDKISYISKHYPLSPQLLKFAMLLCITNYQYSDVEHYFDRYMKLDRKPEDLKKVVSQALLGSGVKLLKNSKNEEALSYFLKGSIINGRSPEYLNKVVDILLLNHLINEAEYYISMFEPEDVGGSLYKQLLFKINAEKNTYDKVLEEGKGLINSGDASPDIFLKVLDILKTTRNDKILEAIVYKAMDQYPTHKDTFKSYLP